MRELSEQQQILDEARNLDSNISDELVEETSAFLSSEENKAELKPVALKQVSEKLLGLLSSKKETDEN